MMLYNELKKYGNLKIKEKLSKHTSYKIGGPADFFVEVESVENTIKLLKFLEENNLDFFILGGGSNILFNDEGFSGVVVNINCAKINIKEDLVEAEAGCPTVTMARTAVQAGLIGFEWGVGVPGTIGGAVRGNAGAMGGEIKDNLEKVVVYRAGEILELNNQECEFGYRESVFKHNNDIILKAFFKLQKGDTKEAMKKALEYIQQRNANQPQGNSCAGCVFKNVVIKEQRAKSKPASSAGREQIELIEELDKEKAEVFLKNKLIPAGWLVEQVGMKGEQEGMAKVSEKHGNFIVNLGGATAKDILILVEKIKEKVYDKFGITLEEEIKIV